MNHTVETIKKALQNHWDNQNNVSFEVLETEILGLEKELQNRECNCARHSIYDDKRDSEWKLIKEILAE